MVKHRVLVTAMNKPTIWYRRSFSHGEFDFIAIKA